MDRAKLFLRNKINVEKIKNFLIEHKISVIAITVIVLLGCISIVISYAFFQSSYEETIVGGRVGKIADLEVRVMAQNRDSSGNATTGYSYYPYIPKAGYKYNAEKSYCTNGSTITFANDEATISNIHKNDVCYVYFDSIASLDITLNVYAEDVNSDGKGTGNYTKLETTALPSIGYAYDHGSCKNGSTVSYNDAENLFTVEASGKDVCNVYMAAMDVDVALKIYLQAKPGSSEYYEAKTIPNNVYYVLNSSKSSCTGSSTLSIDKQRVVVSATSRTSCEAYLDISTGPIVEEVKATTVSGQNVTMRFAASNLGSNITRWYYSVNNGSSYSSTTSTSVTVSLAPMKKQTVYIYGIDSSGKQSAIIPLEVETGYIYNGAWSYSNSARSKRIEVTGYYKLEVWGAEGGYRSSQTYSGKGGYSTGIVHLNEGDTIYIYTGGFPGSGTSGCGTSDNICPGGYNGGGYRYKYYGGGGGSDIRINSTSLYARVIVAGGGGSDGATSRNGMYGGGTTGGSTTQNYGTGGYGGTQTGNTWLTTTQVTTGLTSNSDAYAGFGFGGGGLYRSSGYGGAGGGGWYGGSGSYPDGSGDDDRGGGGGSGYVYTASTASSYPTGCLLNSNYYLTSESTVDGNTAFLSPTGVSETGHTGSGYAKVTWIGQTLS